MPPFLQYPTLPPYYHQPYAPSSSQMHHSSVLVPVYSVYPAQFSDSIIDKQDLLEKLITYFTWLITKSPMQATTLNITKETLIK